MLKSLEIGLLVENELATLLQELRGAAVFGPDADFGFPGVTDLDSTSTEVVLDGERRFASAYALYKEFADDPALTPDQAEARAELMSIVSAALAAATSVPSGSRPALETPSSGLSPIRATGHRPGRRDQLAVERRRHRPGSGAGTRLR